MVGMRAVIQREFGGPEVLRVEDVDPPAAIPTDILVKVHAIGVNPVEAMIRSGGFPLLGQPPFILGWEVSGVVERSLPGPGRFAEGDEVYGLSLFPRAANAYAEYLAGPSRMFARKPATVDHVHAAALPVVALTAYQGLIEYAGLHTGDTVLIHAGGGGVGHVAVQLAKTVGARVIATASTGKVDFVRGLGADKVIDYTAVDFADTVDDVDVVFDLIGADVGRRSLRTLRPGGTLVTAVQHSDAAFKADVESAGFRFIGVAVEPDAPALEKLTTLVDAGKIRPHVDHTLPLDEAPKAHELIETGHTKGKIVLVP
jgi:NADPH:quinone reductase-like Zn-dependent oxidoreductase